MKICFETQAPDWVWESGAQHARTWDDHLGPVNAINKEGQPLKLVDALTPDAQPLVLETDKEKKILSYGIRRGQQAFLYQMLLERWGWFRYASTGSDDEWKAFRFLLKGAYDVAIFLYPGEFEGAELPTYRAIESILNPLLKSTDKVGTGDASNTHEGAKASSTTRAKVIEACNNHMNRSGQIDKHDLFFMGHLSSYLENSQKFPQRAPLKDNLPQSNAKDFLTATNTTKRATSTKR